MKSASLVAWSGVLLILGLVYLTIPVSPDQALFDYIAWSHIQGDTYYANVAEQNWPGIMLIHELGIRLFGVKFWTFRAIDFVLMLICTAAGAHLLRRAGFLIAPTVFLLLYPPLYITSGYWMAGQRDIVAVGILVVASALYLSVDRQKTRSVGAKLQTICVGGTVALAFMIRPTFLLYLAGLLLLEWLRFPTERQLSRGVRLNLSLLLVLGFALPVMGVLLVGHNIGALDDFYQQAVLFNLEAYQVQASRWRLLNPLASLLLSSWHWITLLGFMGLIFWVARRGLTRSQALIIGLMMTVFVSYFVQNKGFLYHLGGLLTVLSLLAAVGIDCLAEWRASRREAKMRLLATALLFLTVALALTGTVKKLASYAPNLVAIASGHFQPVSLSIERPDWTDMSDTVRLIQADRAGDDFVLQWGRNFELPYLAERRSSLRFVSTPALILLAPSFTSYQEWLDEIKRDLTTRRPRFAIVESAALVSDGKGGFLPRLQASVAENIILKQVLEYEVIKTTDHYILLKAP